MNLGSLEIKNPLVLAPIAGFTDSPYRSIASEEGCGFTVTELVSSEGLIRYNKKTLELMTFSEAERPFGIQIFGRKPDVMAQAAVIAAELHPDFIDINMGCPARKVCRDGDGAGAALLKDPVLAGRIAEAVVKAVSLPVSAKIRTGWDSSSVNYTEVIKALEDGGVSFIALHGRTKVQGYSGEADWHAVETAAAAAKVPLIGNGDILTREQALFRLENSGCAAVMIGRGACGNPWIFSGREPSAAERIAMIKRHLDLNMNFYGDWGLVLMRKHTVKYISGLPGASAVRSVLNVAPDRASVHRILDEYLAGLNDAGIQ